MLPPPNIPYEDAPASDELLVQHLRQAPQHTVTVLCLGPLSNLVSAEQRSPGVLSLAKEIVVMGGAFWCPGNITSQAEFNVSHGPEDYVRVLASCRSVSWLPLDVTTKLVMTPADIDRLTQHDNMGSGKPTQLEFFVKELFKFQVKQALNYKETGGVPGMLMHDASTVAYAIYPQLFLFQRGHVKVETGGSFSRGRTMLDDRLKPQPASNSWVAKQVEAQNVIACFAEDLQSLFKILRKEDTSG